MPLPCPVPEPSYQANIKKESDKVVHLSVLDQEEESKYPSRTSVLGLHLASHEPSSPGLRRNSKMSALRKSRHSMSLSDHSNTPKQS